MLWDVKMAMNIIAKERMEQERLREVKRKREEGEDSFDFGFDRKDYELAYKNQIMEDYMRTKEYLFYIYKSDNDTLRYELDRLDQIYDRKLNEIENILY